MSVQDVLTRLKVRFAAATPVGQPQLVRVYDNVAEAISGLEFPCAVLMLEPKKEHRWELESFGSGNHAYSVCAYLFVGMRNTGYPELQQRSQPWPEAIADALLADVTLGGTISHLGEGSDDTLFSYQIGPWLWADAELFGIRFSIPIRQIEAQAMG